MRLRKGRLLFQNILNFKGVLNKIIYAIAFIMRLEKCIVADIKIFQCVTYNMRIICAGCNNTDVFTVNLSRVTFPVFGRLLWIFSKDLCLFFNERTVGKILTFGHSQNHPWESCVEPLILSGEQHSFCDG